MIDALRNTISRLAGDRKRLEEQRAATVRRLTVAEEALAWVRGVIEGLQRATHARISDVVTKCLRFVFGDDAYQFVIRFEGAGKTRFEFVRGGETFDPDDQVGGGVLDVTAFALRLAVLAASHDAPVLVLDEPFRFVSKEYRPRVAELLAVLADEFRMQIVMVTHAEELVCGDVIRILGDDDE